MKAIEQSGFAPAVLNPAVGERTSKSGKTLNGPEAGMGKVASPVHREPGFCERHLLDENLGPEIRRTWW